MSIYLQICIYNTFLIAFIIGYQVNFNITCDDYCVRVKNGNNIIYEQLDDSLLCITHFFSAEVSLGEPISIVTKNNQGPFTFTGSIDFTYFSLSTKRRDLWSVGLPEEMCYAQNVQYDINNSMFIIKGNLDSQICTFTLPLEICLNPTYYIPYGEQIRIDYINIIDVETSTNFNKMLVTYVFYGLNGGLLNINNKVIVSGQHYKASQIVNYISNNDIQFWTEDQMHKIEECRITFIICGEHCSQCDSQTGRCLVCENNYSFVDSIDVKDCYLKSDYLSYSNYYYIDEQNLCIRCYSSCKFCLGEGTESFHNCLECADLYYAYELTDES